MRHRRRRARDYEVAQENPDTTTILLGLGGLVLAGGLIYYFVKKKPALTAGGGGGGGGGGGTSAGGGSPTGGGGGTFVSPIGEPISKSADTPYGSAATAGDYGTQAFRALPQGLDESGNY